MTPDNAIRPDKAGIPHTVSSEPFDPHSVEQLSPELLFARCRDDRLHRGEDAGPHLRRVVRGVEVRERAK